MLNCGCRSGEDKGGEGEVEDNGGGKVGEVEEERGGGEEEK